MRNLQLNTSVTALFKDKSTQTYDTIEEASAETGISIASIKTRCGKKGCGAKSKDGILFEWADEHTRKSKQAKRNRTKGNGFELEIIKKLKEIGFTGCVSSRSQDKRADSNKIDIVDMDKKLPVNIQSKYTTNTPNYFAIRDACSDKETPFTLVWKKATPEGDSPGTVVFVPFDYFLKLLHDSANCENSNKASTK